MFKVLCKFVAVWLAIQLAAIASTGNAALAYACAGAGVTALGFLITPPQIYVASSVTAFTAVPLYHSIFGFDHYSLIILSFFVLGGILFFIAALFEPPAKKFIEELTPELAPAMEQ